MNPCKEQGSKRQPPKARPRHPPVSPYSPPNFSEGGSPGGPRSEPGTCAPRSRSPAPSPRLFPARQHRARYGEQQQQGQRTINGVLGGEAGPLVPARLPLPYLRTGGGSEAAAGAAGGGGGSAAPSRLCKLIAPPQKEKKRRKKKPNPALLHTHEKEEGSLRDWHQYLLRLRLQGAMATSPAPPQTAARLPRSLPLPIAVSPTLSPSRSHLPHPTPLCKSREPAAPPPLAAPGVPGGEREREDGNVANGGEFPRTLRLRNAEQEA